MRIPTLTCAPFIPFHSNTPLYTDRLSHGEFPAKTLLELSRNLSTVPFGAAGEKWMVSYRLAYHAFLLILWFLIFPHAMLPFVRAWE